MVAQKKGGVAGKQKSKVPFQAAPPKVFEVDDDEFDDDDDVESSGSEDDVEEMPVNKKTPSKGMATPDQSKSGKKKDMHVSFQLQNKNTPQNKQQQQKTPKGTPMPGKKTPVSKPEVVALSGKRGKGPLKEFGGMSNIFGGKVETLDPPQKGKIYKAALGTMKGTLALAKAKQGKGKGAQDDDDDDDDDDEDEDSDDDFNDDDLEEEDNDLDDDLDDEDLDDDEDDVEDLGSDEEKEIRQTIMAIKGKAGQKGMIKNTPQKEAAQPKEQKTPNQRKENNSQTPNKGNQTPASNKKMPKTLLKREAPKDGDQSGSPAKDQNRFSEQSIALEKQRRQERDSRNLFIRGVPVDATVAELKSLSPDILDVSLPKSKFQKKNRKVKNYYAFLEFANEKKAEENFAILQNKKLRGQPLYVDFVGEKSKNRSIAALQNAEEQKTYNKKKLFVSGLTCETTINQVANLFPKAFNITLNSAPEYRNAVIQFRTEVEAAEAYEANSNVKLNGRQLTVLYSLESKKNKKKSGTKRPQKEQQNKSAGPPAKRFKAEPKAEKILDEESDDDDDDDDDEEEDDEE